MNEKLRSARLKKGWSQEEAAEAASISVRAYQRWEQGTHTPNFELRRLLRKAFAATDEELGFAFFTPLETFEQESLAPSVPLTSGELAALSDLLTPGGGIMVRFDESKRDALRKLLTFAGAAMLSPQILGDTEPFLSLVKEPLKSVDDTIIEHFEQ